MHWSIRKRYRRLIRRESADIVIAMADGIVANLITDTFLGRRQGRMVENSLLPEVKNG